MGTTNIFITMQAILQNPVYRSLEDMIPSVGPGNARDPDCSICYTPFEAQDILLRHSRCGASWHADCVLSWLTDNISCPWCRSELRQGSDVATDDDDTDSDSEDDETSLEFIEHGNAVRHRANTLFAEATAFASRPHYDGWTEQTARITREVDDWCDHALGHEIGEASARSFVVHFKSLFLTQIRGSLINSASTYIPQDIDGNWILKPILYHALHRLWLVFSDDDYIVPDWIQSDLLACVVAFDDLLLRVARGLLQDDLAHVTRSMRDALCTLEHELNIAFDTAIEWEEERPLEQATSQILADRTWTSSEFDHITLDICDQNQAGHRHGPLRNDPLGWLARRRQAIVRLLRDSTSSEPW